MTWQKGVIAFTFLCLGWGAHAQNGALPAPTANMEKPGAQTISQPAPASPSMTGHAAIVNDDSYRLGAGDKMKITVYGEQDLSGEFLVSSNGRVQFPLVGEIQAVNLTAQEFAKALTAELGAKYLRNPKVSIEIQTFRPFYIIGEVNKPGEYAYESGLSLHGAVALAGGYTYRANDSNVYIRRVGSDAETAMRVTGQIKIYPGDVVRIPERFF
ncbi:MAG TPA: polysaccharide biosynthesis/export family protein [Rhizomicrobium sp.]|nr:polysaccharide biosynthesis/export family protein [Rhizomicrobium sp.]